MGCKKAPPITLSAQATPPAIYPGEPVTVTATPGSVSTKKNNSVIYSWSGTGVTGSDTTAKVDTSSLAPGAYTVKAEVKEGKKGKEGLKPGQTADASANFTVKEFEPPTISCSANPTTLKPGDSSSITATGMSPQNRPLTYTYSASAGTINGSGNTATFSSTGAPTGPVTITCNVSDDKGHNASAETSLTIEAPPAPPPQPKTQALCSITFTTDTKRPTRVDNEAKACLDQVALSLQQQPDAKAVVVGESTTKEKADQEKMEKREARLRHPKPVENFSAQRAVNTKQYLVTDKGIDPSRITAATGTGDNQQVEDYLVPAGADFSVDVPGTTPVDENTVKPQERKPMAERHHHHKKMAM